MTGKEFLKSKGIGGGTNLTSSGVAALLDEFSETFPLGYLESFVKAFKGGKNVYLEDSVMWYCLEMGIRHYISLTIHQRINFKQSYFINVEKQ